MDGVALVVAGALLTIHHSRQGHDLVAAVYLVFTVGEGLILSVAAMDPVASVPLFAAGAGLWDASLALISAPNVMHPIVRGVGFIASFLFAVIALQAFAGRTLTPLSEPLPFFAYPFLAATMFGWAWVHLKWGRTDNAMR